MLSIKTTLAAALLGSVALTACQAADDAPAVTAEVPAVAEATEEASAPEVVPNTIVTIAAGTDDLSTLVAAVTAAGLVDTLNSDGPFTAQKDALTGVLTYHVVAGEVMASDLVAAISAEEDGVFDITTVNGAVLSASIVDGAPILTDANGNTSAITATDVDASNGVVHLIDSVVMPG